MVKLRSYFPLATLLDLLLICAGFASLAYLNREWLLDDFGNVDKWIYTAFFLHYDIPSVLADDKKIARLPWVLSGFALHRMFTPIVAAQILHGGYFLLSCTGVYIAIKKLLDRSVALLTALFCLFCVELHGPGGWDYHDLAGGAFYLFSYVALASAAETQKRPFMPFFAAGILLALTAHTNIISINLFPVFAIEVVAALKRRNFIFSQNKAWLTTASAGVFLGAAACTIALGLINLGAGRQFFFFSRLLQVSQELLLDPSLQQPWWRDWSSLWWAKETDMALYGGVLVLAVPVLAYTAVKRRAVWSDVTTVLLIEYVLGFAVLLGWQIAGQTALQPDYMAYPLMFPMIFALAALIAKVLPRAGPRAFAVSWFCGIAFAIYLLFGDAVERVVVNPLAQTACVLLGRNDLHAVLPFLLLICGLGAVIVLVSYLPRPSGRLRGAYLI